MVDIRQETFPRASMRRHRSFSTSTLIQTSKYFGGESRYSSHYLGPAIVKEIKCRRFSAGPAAPEGRAPLKDMGHILTFDFNSADAE